MLKFTIHMSQLQKSWSEAHYATFTGSPNSQAGNASYLATARQLALGFLAQVNRVVVSNYPANRRTRAFTFELFTNPNNTVNQLLSTNTSIMSNNAPLVQWSGTTIVAPVVDAPPANYYPGGCWQSLFNVDGPNAGELNKGTGGYGGLVSFLNALLPPPQPGVPVSPWCYRTRNPAGQINATAVVPPVAGSTLIGVVTQAQLVDPTNGNAPLTVGQKVYLSGWRVANPRKKNLEGAFKIAAVVTAAGPPATWTYYLFGTDGYQSTNWPVPGFIGPLLFTFASYTGYTVEQWVTRKRGGRYDLPLGRLPVHRSV